MVLARRATVSGAAEGVGGVLGGGRFGASATGGSCAGDRQWHLRPAGAGGGDGGLISVRLSGRRGARIWLATTRRSMKVCAEPW